MPVVKISFSDERHQKLVELAKEQGISVQDYIRNQLFGDHAAFTPAEAVDKALQKYGSGDLFTLPELYGEEWTIRRGFAGVFGKQFFNYVADNCADQIEFVGMTNNNRHAQYRIA